MAEYKGIKGFKVQYLSADPSDPIIGQTWYNDTSKDLKYTGVTTAGAWATGNNLNTARDSIGNAGTQTAGLGFGGSLPPGSNTDATEEYDGSTWTGGGNLNTPKRFVTGTGTQTAAVGFGSGPPLSGETQEYNGTSWSLTNSLNTIRSQIAPNIGTQTAALAAGGDQGPLGITGQLKNMMEIVGLLHQEV
jgi:hypothetical protein